MREAFFYAAALCAVTLFISARSGVVGAVDGCLRRTDCALGYWIVMIAHGAVIAALAVLVIVF